VCGKAPDTIAADTEEAKAEAGTEVGRKEGNEARRQETRPPDGQVVAGYPPLYVGSQAGKEKGKGKGQGAWEAEAGLA